MDNKERVIIPFVTILIDEILCKVEAKTTLKIDRHDLLQEVVTVKNGKRFVRYEDEEGKALAFDENNRLQAFSVVEAIDLVSGDFDAPGLGVSMELTITSAFVKLKDKHINRLWQSVDVFKPGEVIHKRIEDTTNGNQSISGEMKSGTKIKFSPVSIAEKYLPSQISQVRARQLDLSAMEFRYKLKIQNLCTFCIEKA